MLNASERYTEKVTPALVACLESMLLPRKIGVLIVEDNELMRHGLRAVLEHGEGFAVLGEAEDGVSAIE
ncbi:MAG: hypothetical protein KGS72_23565, partial [Cyanobacteria bacterium REEB67]|nr:hypothetical protein [Cyanobacteria bacterium REEB67]